MSGNYKTSGNVKKQLILFLTLQKAILKTSSFLCLELMKILISKWTNTLSNEINNPIQIKK